MLVTSLPAQTRLRRSLWRAEVLDDGVGAREEQCRVARVVPANVEGRLSIIADGDDLAFAVGVADMVSLDDDLVSNGGSHPALGYIVVTYTLPIWRPKQAAP